MTIAWISAIIVLIAAVWLLSQACTGWGRDNLSCGIGAGCVVAIIAAGSTGGIAYGIHYNNELKVHALAAEQRAEKATERVVTKMANAEHVVAITYSYTSIVYKTPQGLICRAGWTTVHGEGVMLTSRAECSSKRSDISLRASK